MQKEKNKEIFEKLETELKLRGSSEKTIKIYGFFISQYLNMLDKNTEETSEDDVKKFLASLIEKYNNTSRALATSSLRFLYKKILNKPNIISNIENPKKEKVLPSVLTKEEINNLIPSAETKKSKLIIKLLYGSGLRVSELVNLEVKNLNLQEKTGIVKKGKGKKDRIFIIPETLIQEIKEQIEKNPNSVYLFSKDKPLTTRNIQKIIKKAAKKAQIGKKVTPHTLRHSFATHLLDSGENLFMIQQLLGHENLETTRIYSHISQEQIKKVKSPLDKL